jgi:hypothetical protein
VKLKRYGGIFALCFLLPVVSGCSDKANRLALNDRLLFTQGRGPLAGSVIVGEVTGGSVQLLNPYGISNDEYKEALTLSLRANHLIAEDSMAAQ